MKILIYSVCLSIFLTGCIAAPSRSIPVPVVGTYVAPNYPMPGLGYQWQLHPQFGWGWNHPN